jgi:hypothetical protein
LLVAALQPLEAVGGSSFFAPAPVPLSPELALSPELPLFELFELFELLELFELFEPLWLELAAALLAGVVWAWGGSGALVATGEEGFDVPAVLVVVVAAPASGFVATLVPDPVGFCIGMLFGSHRWLPVQTSVEEQPKPGTPSQVTEPPQPSESDPH